MRIHPWLAAFSSLCLLIAAGESSARAQQASSAVFESSEFDDAIEGRVTLKSTSTSTDAMSQLRGQSPGPMAFNPAYGPPNPAAMWPQGAPPETFHPYPKISPYYSPNIGTDTTYHRNGLWFRELLHRNRDYFLTLEYLLVGYRRPGNSTVGADPAPFFTTNPSPTNVGGGAAGTVSGGLVGVVVNNYGLAGPALFGLGDSGGIQRVSVGPGVFPYPFLFDAPAQATRQAVVDEDLFPIHTVDNCWFNGGREADGMRVRWGYFDEDGSGLMLTGWFGDEGRGRFVRGTDNYNDVPVTQAFIFANSPPGGFAPVFPRNGALPLITRDDFLDSGANPLTDLVTTGFDGITQKFDVLFDYDFRTSAAGGALHWYHEPIYKRKWVTVRPTVGARYQYVDERFGFRGIDSGLGYDALQLGTAAGGNNQGVPTYRPATTDIFAVVDDVGNGFFFEANLKSEIDSHMAGPEAGVRYDFGTSKHFSIWGQSTFALLANHQRINLTGQNIGDPINYWLVTGDNWADPTDGINTQFKDEKTHTSASPMFEQSVFLEIDIFRYIPILKNLHVLEDAQFQTGYTYTVIGAVNRPADVIVWNSFPEFPAIRSDRSTWDTHNWSFAINWKF